MPTLSCEDDVQVSLTYFGEGATLLYVTVTNFTHNIDVPSKLNSFSFPTDTAPISTLTGGNIYS